MTLTGEQDSKHSYLTDDLDWWAQQIALHTLQMTLTVEQDKRAFLPHRWPWLVSMTASIHTSYMTLTGDHNSQQTYLTDGLPKSITVSNYSAYGSIVPPPLTDKFEKWTQVSSCRTLADLGKQASFDHNREANSIISITTFSNITIPWLFSLGSNDINTSWFTLMNLGIYDKTESILTSKIITTYKDTNINNSDFFFWQVDYLTCTNVGISCPLTTQMDTTTHGMVTGNKFN